MIATDVMDAIEELIDRSLMVVVEFSGLTECNIITTIYNPMVGFANNTIIMSNYSDEDDENKVRFDLDDFEFNEHNSNEDRLVFNSKRNFVNSLGIQRVDVI